MALSIDLVECVELAKKNTTIDTKSRLLKRSYNRLTKLSAK